MPAVFALGLRKGLLSAREQLHPDDRIIAYLDDLYLVTTKERARSVFEITAQAVEEHAGIQQKSRQIARVESRRRRRTRRFHRHSN